MAAAHLAEDLKEEVTCPVCMDYFTHPVTLGCGHSFCHLCLLGSCGEVDQPSFCPECRRAYQMRDLEPNHRLRKLASIARNLRPYLLQIREERITCEKHKEEQNLFCEEDQSFLCASCFQSQEHNGHTVQPLNKAAEASRDKLQETLDLLWKEVETIQNMLAKERQNEEIWNEQTNAWRELVGAEYGRLFNFLNDEEKQYFNRLAWDEKENLQKLRESEVRLSQHLQKLKEEIINIEEICQKPNLQLLQVSGDTFRKIKSLLIDRPEPARHPLTMTCITAMFEMMNKFRVNVTLDPASASPYLIVSNDLKTVRNGGCLQNVPFTPDRFEDDIILGAQVFTSGIHYWEVHVGDSQEWTVGVCKESLSRNPEVPLVHGDVFVITYIQDEDTYTVISNCSQILRQSAFPIRRILSKIYSSKLSTMFMMSD
ncbi:probable E3 ubiquitin-protein ligase TRIML1 [Trichosurus vulpecula]|uniref:probable E3 ubiquitin-protein ligase TRIML1 n=1 Tax=Trichosurus vulpecula TaxID=9337 RepID=UPI00186B1209|nr:probable E3 ubiquitin-protein ligase TRIML1 [Trichosurus vulpecula]